MIKRLKRHSARELYCTKCQKWHTSAGKIYDKHYKYLIEKSM